MKGPLAGIRILEVGTMLAGPYATMMLADLGAEVIKVENHHIWQPFTRGTVPRPTRQMVEGGQPWIAGFPDWDPGEKPWERLPSSIHLFRSKYSMTVDLRIPSGQEIFRRLVEKSDVVYENNVPETAEKLGLTFAKLSKINPGIVVFHAPAFGMSGPYKNYRAFGSHIEAVIGHAMLRGYEGEEPSVNTPIYPGDFTSGVCGAFAIIAALLHRKKTGRGQEIEMAQAENNMSMFAQAIMDYSLNGRVQGSRGNHDIHGASPNEAFPCAGTDRWISISVTSDEEWLALCDVLGADDLAEDNRFRSVLGRQQHQDEVERRIAEYTRTHNAEALMHLLQARGVAAGAVLSSADILDDPHFADRGYFRWVDHEHTMRSRWPGPFYRLSETPLEIRRPPASLGQDNDYVYKTVLGYSGSEYEEIKAQGHIGDTLDESIR